MSGETSDSERSALVNGLGHESAGMGVSGTTPLLNGDLRDGEREDQFSVSTAGTSEPPVSDVLPGTVKPVDIVAKVSRLASGLARWGGGKPENRAVQCV